MPIVRLQRLVTICVAALALLFVWQIGPAAAQGLQVSPILISLPPAQLATTLMVTNKGQAVTKLQLRPFAWDQSGSADALKPTTTLAVSPPFADVSPDQTQIFRIVLRHPPDGVESCFRLLLDQIPPGDTPGAVTVALRFSIPVFAASSGAISANLIWRIDTAPAGALLIGRNTGTMHARILNPELTESSGPALKLQADASSYILPGAERSWRVPASFRLRPGATAHLTAISDTGPIDAAIQVPSP